MLLDMRSRNNIKKVEMRIYTITGFNKTYLKPYCNFN